MKLNISVKITKSQFSVLLEFFLIIFLKIQVRTKRQSCLKFTNDTGRFKREKKFNKIMDCTELLFFRFYVRSCRFTYIFKSKLT